MVTILNENDSMRDIETAYYKYINETGAEDTEEEFDAFMDIYNQTIN